jgi:hypothetical protein
MNELEIPRHRRHNSLDFEDHSKLLVAHELKVTIDDEFIPLLIIDIKFRGVEVVPWDCYGHPTFMRGSLVLILI